MRTILFWFLLIAFSFWGCENQSEAARETSEISSENSEPSLIPLSMEQMDVGKITLGQAQKRVLENALTCNGVVELPPQNLISVYPPHKGFVEEVRFLPGDYVKKGNLLVVLRHPDLVRLQRTFLECKSALPTLEKDFERKKMLADSNALAPRVLEEVESRYRVEMAKYKGLKSELEMLGINVPSLEETESIQTSIRVYAPAAGYISKMEINKGKLVEMEDMMYEIVDNNHVHLELKVFAKDLSRIKKRPGYSMFCSWRK